MLQCLLPDALFRFSALSDGNARGPSRLDRQVGQLPQRQQPRVIQRSSQERERSEALQAARWVLSKALNERFPGLGRVTFFRIKLVAND